MTIAIIGYGYVGKAMTEFFAYKKHNEVMVYDPKEIKSHSHHSVIGLEYGGYAYEDVVDKKVVNSADVGVICVPTPATPDGSCDTSIVDEVVSWLETPLIIIKSTVSVGTTDKLKEKYNKRIVFSPEYCGESSYWTPYKFHTKVIETPFFIFGGDKQDTSKCVDIYMKIAGMTKRYFQTDSKTAEMVKYMENSFYATKVTFCYEIAEICERLGIDYNEAREMWVADPRMSPMHTAVFKDNKGFGKKCYPKDINALIKTAENVDYDPKFLKEVWASNLRFKCQGGQKNG